LIRSVYKPTLFSRISEKKITMYFSDPRSRKMQLIDFGLLLPLFSLHQVVNKIQSRKQSRKLGRYKMSSVYRIQVITTRQHLNPLMSLLSSVWALYQTSDARDAFRTSVTHAVFKPYISYISPPSLISSHILYSSFLTPIRTFTPHLFYSLHLANVRMQNV
jgi:hypothetical protein